MKDHNEPVFKLGGKVQLSPPRQPEGDDEHMLISGGWIVQGFSLWSHPILGRKNYTKSQALELNDSVKDYCPVCGMCEDDLCCNPDDCKCLYGKKFLTNQKRGNTDDK